MVVVVMTIIGTKLVHVYEGTVSALLNGPKF